MPDAAREKPKPKGWLRGIGIGIGIGFVALTLGAVALLTMYLNRVSEAAASVSRVGSLASYEGRPGPVVVDGVNAINYVVTTVNADGRLEAVLIAHLSASRRSLTLVAVPSDVKAGPATLAARQAIDPVLVARDLESLTAARMDYQVQVDLSQLAPVVDAIGGAVLDGRRLNGVDALAALEAPDEGQRSPVTAELLRATLAQAGAGSVLADPSRFDSILDALTPCLTVDANLTEADIQSTLVESRVHAAEIKVVELTVNRDGDGSSPEASALDGLRRAFAADDFTGLR